MSNPNRDPKGTPTGGQFAPGSNAAPAPEVALVEGAPPAPNGTSEFVEAEWANFRAMEREATSKGRDDEMPPEPTLGSALDSLDQMPDDVFEDITGVADPSVFRTYLQGAVDRYGEHAGIDVLVTPPAEDRPIEMADGWDESFEGDRELVDQYTVQRNGETYTATGTVFAATASYVLDAEEITDEAFTEIMLGPRWRAMAEFFENRYPDTSLSDVGDGDGLALDVGHDFDHAPTQREVVDALWPTVARIANETDAGTFGSEFAGRLLQEDMDKHAFVAAYPLFADGRWYPGEPMDFRDALTEVDEATKTGATISDRAVQTLVYQLADRHPAFAQLSSTGRADRQQLANAVDEVAPSGAHIALAVARWADAQPTTTDLIKSAPKKKED